MRTHTFERAYLAATIASGLIAKHGVDHGGISPEDVADKSLAIADAILAKSEDVDAGDEDKPAPRTVAAAEPKES